MNKEICLIYSDFIEIKYLIWPQMFFSDFFFLWDWFHLRNQELQNFSCKQEIRFLSSISKDSFTILTCYRFCFLNFSPPELYGSLKRYRKYQAHTKKLKWCGLWKSWAIRAAVVRERFGAGKKTTEEMQTYADEEKQILSTLIKIWAFWHLCTKTSANLAASDTRRAANKKTPNPPNFQLERYVWHHRKVTFFSKARGHKELVKGLRNVSFQTNSWGTDLSIRKIKRRKYPGFPGYTDNAQSTALILQEQWGQRLQSAAVALLISVWGFTLEKNTSVHS